jgi:hypothetical protein
MKKLIILATIFVSISVKAQVFKKSIFIDNRWFVEKDTLAMTDTIKLIRVDKYETHDENIGEEYVAYFYAKEKLRSVKFKENKELLVSRPHLLPCGFSYFGYLTQWDLNEESQIITFIDAKRKKYEYKIIKSEKDHIEYDKKFERYKCQVHFEADLTFLTLLRV